MAFLVLASAQAGQTDPSPLLRAAGGVPVVWFDPGDHSKGGAVCLSPLATTARLRRGDAGDCLIVGRVRLDRRKELCASLATDQGNQLARLPDAELCLLAYARWGERFVDYIHGDFAFVIYDDTTRELVCARDRFGVRMLAWCRRGEACWIAGSMQDLCAVAAPDAGELDSVWISNFLRSGLCEDPARSVYAGISRLPPAHLLSLGPNGLITERYWALEVAQPLHLKSRSDYIVEFHSRLDAAMRDRLPSGQLGIMLSGGLDSSTLAAKALELGAPGLKIVARTWLVGGEADPEAQASATVAAYLGIEQTVLDGTSMRIDPQWSARATAPPEPSLDVLTPPAYFADTQAMRAQAACWFYGEGPDNALTFEWQMHLKWLVRHRQWGRLPAVVVNYLATKPLADWTTSFQTRLGLCGHRHREGVWPEPNWVRCEGSPNPDNQACDWRPRAHRGLSSPLWQLMFERFDAEGERLGIEWRHPYMDLRVLEFLLATPPIPWARRKMLIRRAMEGKLPEEILRRPKTPLHRDDTAELLRRHLPAMPRPGDAIEDFVDLEKLPEDPASHPDIYALTRVAILHHWLRVQHG
ncbi:hypothetical protein GVM20_00520 [Porphyrobacter sp. SLTP]|uniref:asparagine synthase-related protein n=1 Tax=Porphyrobacter sp. SLTP TaxID=2683266 RepID=UPI001411C97A|nr:asparagine synthase-related protein [Porphyrobacter sp. SLTP]NBB23606.1 hypothetical protein [Porphyrobacter sp. SLTP]